MHAGDIVKKVGWIISGSFKHSLIDSMGNSKAVGFVFQDSILTNYNSLMFGRDLPTDLIAMENSEIMTVPAELIRDRLLSDQDLNIAFANALFQAYGHILNTYRYSPEERYRMLQKNHPRLFELASLGEIASYLNISRRQLHRFRLSDLKNQ